MWVMDATDELLYLAHHQAVHYVLLRWIWLVDVCAYLKKFGSEVDWAGLAERVKRYKVKNTVSVSVSYAYYYFPEALDSNLKKNLERFLMEVDVSFGKKFLLHLLANPEHPFDAWCRRSEFARKLTAICMGQDWKT